MVNYKKLLKRSTGVKSEPREDTGRTLDTTKKTQGKQQHADELVPKTYPATYKCYIVYECTIKERGMETKPGETANQKTQGKNHTPRGPFIPLADLTGGGRLVSNTELC